ncbi:hypothetical protein ACFFX0_22165 [Citricoccus parietis]|uniref:Uncharacterized protein n=1 Tax=Citricoccus parietis TaxID=592307 RepID=A0ABV5G537_9MICC
MSACTWELGPVRPMRVRAVTDFPEPDSPMTATHSPAWICTETSCTTWLRRPWASENQTLRFSTSARGRGAAPAAPEPRAASVRRGVAVSVRMVISVLLLGWTPRTCRGRWRSGRWPARPGPG